LKKAIPDFKPSLASDDFSVQKAAAIAGLGAMIMSESESLQESSLVEIDIGVRLLAVYFNLVCAKSMSGMRNIHKVSHLLIELFLNAP